MNNRVYVVELGSSAGRRVDPELPWLYVGQSWHEPEVRFAIHKAGGWLSSKLVRDHGRFLRPDLYDDLPRMSAEQATEAERVRAVELSQCGFVAHSDGVTYRTPDGEHKLWSFGRLVPVLDWVDQAVFALMSRASRAVTFDLIVRLATRPSEADIRETFAVPVIEIGRFAHVLPEAIAQRLGQLVEHGILTDRASHVEFARAAGSTMDTPENR